MTKLIAEIGWNHMGDMVLAKDMITAAKESGCDFAKFQTWSVDRVPRMSELAESGNLEQDAEIVVFSHYPWVSRYGDDGNSDCYLELIVAKNRYGSTNSCEVGYHGNSCLVTDSEADAIKIAKNMGDNVSGTPKPF